MIRCHIARTPNRKPRISRIFYITHLLFFLTLIFSVAYAGEYHNSAWKGAPADTLACSQCHSMHNSQGGVSMQYYGGVTPQPKLLRASSILELCKYCHGTGNLGAIDLEGRVPPPVYNTYNQKNYVPSAGDFADSNVDTNEANRHSVGTDVTTTTPPGYDNTKVIWTGGNSVTGRFGSTFNCLYCHDQHGNSNYRNLRYDPGNPGNDNASSGVTISYSADIVSPYADPNVATADVNYWGAGADTSTNNRFSRNNVRFRFAPQDTVNRGISAWCGRCHTKFYGISEPYGNETSGPYLGGSTSGGVGGGDTNTATSPWRRHPVQDINIGATNLHTDTSSSAYIASGTIRTVDPDGSLANKQPFCLSCHYAHGGGNATAAGNMAVNHSNLVMIDGAGRLNIGDINYIPPDNTTNANAARMRNVCQQCHNQ